MAVPPDQATPRSDQPSAYDGHDNYRAEFARRSPRQFGLAVLRRLLAIGVGLAAMRFFYKLTYPDENILLFLTGPFSALLGLIAGAWAFTRLTRQKADPADSAGYQEIIAAGIFVLVFVLPVIHTRAEEKEQRIQAKLEDEKQAREFEVARQATLDEGLAAMRAAGRFAEPGVVPPDFEVQDKGITVNVTYRGTNGSDISLSRVIADPDAPGGWRGCALWTAGESGYGRFYRHYTKQDLTLVFTMYTDCVKEFHDAPLEFRVGNPESGADAGAKAWWSESAFARPRGREWEHMERRSAASRQPE